MNPTNLLNLFHIIEFENNIKYCSINLCRKEMSLRMKPLSILAE
ncbi:hypothetical protein [Vibrio gallaecicus]|nr:hypothetical protein [Vibrio gallaecicus]MDN3614856.1 hypothetical protein [Vibrio gallaecicus]